MLILVIKRNEKILLLICTSLELLATNKTLSQVLLNPLDGIRADKQKYLVEIKIDHEFDWKLEITNHLCKKNYFDLRIYRIDAIFADKMITCNLNQHTFVKDSFALV